MIKTFAFVLIVVFSDGSQERETLKSGTTAAECAQLLVDVTNVVRYKPHELVKGAIVACEEEEET